MYVFFTSIIYVYLSLFQVHMKLVKLQEYGGTSYFIYATRKSFFHKSSLPRNITTYVYTYILYESYLYKYQNLLDFFYIKYIHFF